MKFHTPSAVKTEGKIVFVAFPTKGAVADGKIREEVLRKLASFHQANPDTTFLVPMVQDYQLLPFMQTEATWEKWGNHCRAMIAVSDEVWVIQYDGWDTSVGVTAEVALAKELNKVLMYFLP